MYTEDLMCAPKYIQQFSSNVIRIRGNKKLIVTIRARFLRRVYDNYANLDGFYGSGRRFGLVALASFFRIRSIGNNRKSPVTWLGH